MSTLFGQYLDELKTNKAKVSRLTPIKKARINDLCNKDTSKPLAEEYYRIILTAILLNNKSELEFNKSFDKIFPDRPKATFMEEFSHLAPEVQFIRKHFLVQKIIEEKINMADGKISRLTSEDVKDVLAVELICFIEGLGLDVLKTFKEIYGKIEIDKSEF